jgi:hypothetical protein
MAQYYHIKTVLNNGQKAISSNLHAFFSLEYAKKHGYLIAQHPNGKLVYITHQIIGNFDFIKDIIKKNNDLEYKGTIINRAILNAKIEMIDKTPEEQINELLKHSYFSPKKKAELEKALAGYVIGTDSNA